MSDVSSRSTAPDREHGRGAIALFVDRPVLTLMVALTLVGLGALSFWRLPLRLAPADMARGEINIYVPISQAMTPREVEEQVLEPLEQQIRTIPGIAELTAQCDNDSAFLSVELDSDTDIVLAAAEIRDRAQRAKLEWPRGVDQYFTWREDGSTAPLSFFQILTPERDTSWDDKVDRIVVPHLERVDGVGRVEVWGLLTETLRIWFDQDKLIEHRIDYGALVQRLMADNFARPVGELDDGRQRYMVRVDSKFRSQTEIEDYPVATGLRIKDIARVERVPSVRDSLARFDGKYTYTGILRLAAGANPVDASRAARAAMAELEADERVAGVTFRQMFDQGAMIQDSLQTLLTTSVQGGILAILALLLFLRDLRATIAIGLAIPLALLVAGVYLFFAGRTLDILTMAGMTLAVGMVVDNSVVVLENIRRLREQGRSMRDAAIAGTREIVLAISMATSTTIVVILPMVFMSSDTNLRAALSAIGMTLSVALLGSLFVALLLLPSGMRHLGGMGPRGARRQRSSRWSPVTWLMAANRRMLHFSMRHRCLASLVCIATLGTIVLARQGLDFGEQGGGPFRGGDITLHIEIPRGRTLSEVADEVRGYEQFLTERKAEWNIEAVAVRFDRTSARFDLVLDETVPKEARPKLTETIRAAWPRRPGMQLAMRERASGGMGGGGGQVNDDKNSQNFVIRLFGPDSQFLTERAVQLAARLQTMPEVTTVEVDRVSGNQEVVVDIDRQRLSEFGVASARLNRVMSSGLRGIELTRFEEGDSDVRLIAQFDAERNPSLLDLKETRVFGDTGSFQRVDELSDIRFRDAPERIRRTDGRTSMQVIGTRAEGLGATEFSELLRSVMAEVPLPRGYSWSENSYSGEIGVQLAAIWSALALSVVLMFMLMGVLFEAVIVPFACLVTLPFAGLGAFWSLYFFYGSLDVMAGIGILLLGGIVVNNGIVLLDCISRLRREGRSRISAILRGAKIRMRPIVMTATTTIVGLLPMALFGESTGEGISYVSMSIAVAGGLALCTLFTAFTVPLTYSLIDDLVALTRRAMLWVKARVWRAPA